MKYKTLDWIGRIPFVLLFYALIRMTETPVTFTVMGIAVILVALQFGAIARCLYLGKPEVSR